MTFISQPLDGKIYIAEPSRKGSQKLLWSVMPKKVIRATQRQVGASVPSPTRSP